MTETAPLLRLRGLRTVRDGRVIHNGIDLDIAPGETVVLLGGSGSGKTTLMRMLVGLDTPAAGTCEFAGRDLFQQSEEEWVESRTKIGFAFQDGALFDSLSVRENLEFPLIEHGRLDPPGRAELVRARLAALGLGAIEELYPAELSGGMQKRVGVARAIMLDPALVLYDEPTAGLDPENVRRMNELIGHLHDEGRAAIVVTHDEACALAVADRFVYLADGKIAASQDRHDFRRRPQPALGAYFSGRPTPPAQGVSL